MFHTVVDITRMYLPVVTEHAIDESVILLWGFDTQWSVHQGHINVGSMWHVLDLLHISVCHVMRHWAWRGLGRSKRQKNRTRLQAYITYRDEYIKRRQEKYYALEPDNIEVIICKIQISVNCWHYPWSVNKSLVFCTVLRCRLQWVILAWIFCYLNSVTKLLFIFSLKS